MKQKNLAMLGVAVGCGLVAAIAVAKLSASGGAGPDMVKVLVAKKDIPVKTKLEEKDLDTQLVWADVPRSIVPQDAVTDLEQVKGKELNRTLKKGNPVTISDLGAKDTIAIPEGFKQITIKSNQVDGVGGFVHPGAKVDVMYIERLPSGKARAAIILRDMLVLAVNTTDRLIEGQPRAMQQVDSVSLAVTDRQGTMIALAEQRGHLKLVLRDVTKQDAAKVAGVDGIEWMDDPFDSSGPAPIEKEKPPPPIKLDTVVVARKAVPLNTLVNADNVNDLFATMEVKAAPDGAVRNVDDLKGFYVNRALDPGQNVFKSVISKEAVKVATEAPKIEIPKEAKAPPKARDRYPWYPQTISEAGRTITVYWMEVKPGDWRRFDTEKDADDYDPSKEKGTEKKK
jgi:pilus assembly protein CpaB